MNTYIVSYQRDEDGPWCTNVAKASHEIDVMAHYADCRKVRVDWRRNVGELIDKGCPVVECGPCDGYDRCFDRHDVSVEVFDSSVCFDLVGDGYGDLYIVKNAWSSDDGFYLFYDEIVCAGNNREVLERWHTIVG